MITRIEIGLKADFLDTGAAAVTSGLRDLGMTAVACQHSLQVFYLKGELSASEKERIAQELLADGVTQVYAIDGKVLPPASAEDWDVEITYNPGVMDPVEESTIKAIRDMGITSVLAVKTARVFRLRGPLAEAQKHFIVEKLLANKVVEHVLLPGEQVFHDPIQYRFRLVEIDLIPADDARLRKISKERSLFLNLEEMRAIQAYYRILGRNPTDLELETLAQTWSEHCSHKTLRGRINYQGRVIDNLLKETVMRATRELALPWCVSVFVDNSGVIEFDDEYDVCFKVETHNHPSAVEPYGGANTGIGGVIRDPLGTGLGAKPIANTDVFCFGPPDLPLERLPRGVLHPKRIMKGVVAGVRDYGNRMGIPTINGAVLFDERYIGNPLVYCGTIGVLPKGMHRKQSVPGDYIVVVGGRTGRDGIHGATCSSGELTVESEVEWGGAVQIGNAITEKKLVDTLLQARDRGLYRAITDCGAGGLSSAVGELARETGAVVDLEHVPLKYQGLTYTEIWISEAQERMVIFVPPEKLAEALALFASEDVEATVIGRLTNDRQLVVRYQGHEVGKLDLEFLHEGLPRPVRDARWEPPTWEEPNFSDPEDLTPYLHQILGAWNVCSKEWVVRQYDHEVQGGSALKPLVGLNNDGPGDASIVRPRLDSYRALVVANGINPKYGLIDPYWMAAAAIDEALRNVVAVGGSLERTALLDNFCWGNPDKPDRLGGLVRAAQACYEVAKTFGTPFISGKDSLNNEYTTEQGETIAIPPTLLISAISVMPDCRKAVSMDLKEPGNLIYLVGMTREELGGSHYFAVRGYVGNGVPKVDALQAKKLYEALAKAIAAGLVRACHDCSEGGLGVAIAEMAFAGGRGATIDLSRVPHDLTVVRNDTLLFAESCSRLLVEVPQKAAEEFGRLLAGLPYAVIGQVQEQPRLEVRGVQGRVVVEAAVADLKESWQAPLRW
ncbi:MAG: phosphoribosylformylglycinamidine synthase subunit PurL [candidate division KSB1 bacterium]|nr:phosphoribosylformylglycinamidine synthase subunit PurL [candidate division KSB1 bacterium]